MEGGAAKPAACVAALDRPSERRTGKTRLRRYGVNEARYTQHNQHRIHSNIDLVR